MTCSTKYWQNPNTTTTKPNITLVGFDMKMTLHHHHPPPPTTTANSMSVISQLLLTWFWRNFTGSFLGAYRTDSNYQVDICLCNICPGNICPYQEYLSCYWPDVNQTLKVGFWNLFLTDANHYGDICPINICLGNICPYQEYLSCYWPVFDHTLKIAFLYHL